MTIEILSDSDIKNLIGWLIVSLLTLTLGLFIYIWNDFKKRMVKLESHVLTFIRKHSENRFHINEIQKDIGVLYKMHIENSHKITEAEKDLAVLKSHNEKNGNQQRA